MSKYPVWWDTTITIYNKFEDSQTHVIKWYRTVIEGSFWKYVRDKMTIGSETIQVENTICRIRKNEKFLQKHEWVTIPNDMMHEYFTVGRGDIIVKGEIFDEIDEYTEGKRSSNIISKYKELQGCMEVESVSINIGKGRCNPHYLVEGL